MNKKQGGQIRVFSRKKTRKNKMDSSTTPHTSQWIMLWNGVIDSSVLLELFSFASKCLSCYNREKKAAEMR